MKQIFCVLLLIILSVNLVLAGETYEIDFSKQDSYLVGLKEGDRIKFDLKKEENTVILTKIREESVEIKAYIALNTRNSPYYSDLKQGNKFVMDVDNDGAGDIEVRLYKIQNDVGALYLSKLEGSLWPVGYVVLDENSMRSNRGYDSILVGFFILIGVIITIFILKKNKDKKVENVEKNEDESTENLSRKFYI